MIKELRDEKNIYCKSRCCLMRKLARGFTACVLAVSLLAANFADIAAAEQLPGFGRVDMTASKQIFDNVEYTMQMGVHSSGANQTAYYVTADLKNGAVKPLVFNGTVRSLSTVGQIIKYAENAGYKVLAGINADIYDMSTGTPKGTVIHDYNIVTSGYDPARVLTFNDSGDFKMALSTLHFDISSKIGYMKQMPDEGETQTPPADMNGSGQPAAGTYVEEEYTQAAPFFNVPHGAARALHIFNEHYGSSTMTKEPCVEVVVDFNADSQLRVGRQITGRIVSVNPNTKNTPIGKGQIVLSTPVGSQTSARLAQLIVNSPLTIAVSESNGQLAGVKECVGLYYSIIENGAVATTGTSTNPRTALGVKSDGSVVFLAVDGRQSNHSAGLTLPDLAKYMLSIGCVEAYNLDGGGSTTLYARMPGKDGVATRRNSVSEGNERRVANAFLLVYTGSGGSATEKLHIYPANTYVMPGAAAPLQVYGTNGKYEKTSAPSSVSFSVSDGGGSVDSRGIFTAGSKPGIYTVTATSGGVGGQTVVTVLDKFTIKPSVSNINIAQGKTIDINLSVSSGRASVKSDDSLFTWSCDKNIGVIDGKGNFTAVASANGGQQGKIRANYGDNAIEIPVNVSGDAASDPAGGTFSDTAGHWADSYIAELSKNGIISGMGNNTFQPEATLTRAQFVTLLAKLSGDDLSAASSAGFSDVSDADWFKNAVNWGYLSGVVKGVSSTHFAPDNKITREQMTVMLCNYAAYKKKSIPQIGASPKFADMNAVSPWAADYVVTAAGGGIINGMPDGKFNPAGSATRAQAAKVIYLLNKAIM